MRNEKYLVSSKKNSQLTSHTESTWNVLENE